MRDPIVWIPNKAGHNFSDAKRFGDIRFLSEGSVNQYSTNNIYRVFVEALSEAQEQDFLVVSSLSILNSIASSILAYRFGMVNYLLFKNGRYLERSVVFGSLAQRMENNDAREEEEI